MFQSTPTVWTLQAGWAIIINNLRAFSAGSTLMWLPMRRHQAHPLFREGPPPAAARMTVLFVHGRGGSATDVLAISSQVGLADVAYLAPQADEHTWYPRSFLSPIETNEPGI